MFVFFCKQKTADEMRISDWSSDVGSSDLRTPNGFDRMSTEEELNQVLAFLHEFGRSGWVLPAEDSVDPQMTTLWPDTVSDDSAEAGSLAEQIGRASCRERVCQYE